MHLDMNELANYIGEGLVNAQGVHKPTDLGKGFHRDTYVELMDSAVKKVATRDNVIILGRAGQVILGDKENVIHLRLDGDIQYSVKQVMEREQMSKKEATKQVKMIDRRRCKYLKHFYNCDCGDPSLYDFMINFPRIGKDRFVKFLKTL